MKKMILAFSICLSLSLIGCSSNSNMQYIKAEQKPSTYYVNTNISPCLQADIVHGRNIIYCSSFQLAWDKVKSDVFKEDVKLANQPQIVNYLNSNVIGRNISENNRVTMAGYIKDGIVSKINKELSDKFGSQKKFDYDGSNSDKAILAYGYLFKNLKFSKNFNDLNLSFIADNSGERVGCFGIDPDSDCDYREQLSRQIKIVDYTNDDDFIIQLCTTSQDDEVILAKITPQKNLDECVKYVNSRIANGHLEKFNFDCDILWIPTLSFNITHKYNELINKIVINKGFEQYYIQEARQDIAFQLNKSGIVLESESQMAYAASAIQVSKKLVFDKPFLIFLREKGEKSPYFAAWIGNTELMDKDYRSN